MRFVPANFLKEGMVLGKSLYDKSHNVLLSKNHVLSNSNIKRIIELGYQGLYIYTNEIKNNETTKEIIANEIRQRAKDIIKDTFVAEDDRDVVDSLYKKVSYSVNIIVNKLLSHDDLIINLYDLKTYDDYTFEHSVNVTILSIVIGIRYGLDENHLYELGFGAMMHDIGKKDVEIDILNKKEKLNDDEFKQIKKHPLLGAKFLEEHFKVNKSIVNCALHHHERYDGTGYPLGLKGKEISINGRIIAICDVFDALTSNRVYRKAIHPSEAIQLIIDSSGTHFDDGLIKIFLDYVAPYPLGTTVKLDNGWLGVVVKVKPRLCYRPIVRVIQDQNRCRIHIKDIDLSKPENIHINIMKVVNEI